MLIDPRFAMISRFAGPNGSTVNMDGITYNVTREGKISIPVRGELDERTKKAVHRYFFERVAKMPPGNNALKIRDRLVKIVEYINAYSRDNSAKIDVSDDDPIKKKMDAANALHDLVLTKLHAHVLQNGKFEINEVGFDFNIDSAERYLMQIYQDLFEHYMQMKEYQLALQLAPKIKYSPNANQLYNQLVLGLSAQSQYQATFEAMAYISSLSDEIIQSIVDIPNPYLLVYFHETSCKIAKSAIIQVWFQKGNFFNAELAISTLDTESKTQNYQMIIEHFWKKTNISSILAIIPRFYSETNRTKEYSRILDYYLGLNIQEFENVVESYKQIVSQIYGSSNQETYQLKLEKKLWERKV